MRLVILVAATAGLALAQAPLKAPTKVDNSRTSAKPINKGLSSSPLGIWIDLGFKGAAAGASLVISEMPRGRLGMRVAKRNGHMPAGMHTSEVWGAMKVAKGGKVSSWKHAGFEVGPVGFDYGPIGFGVGPVSKKGRTKIGFVLSRNRAPAKLMHVKGGKLVPAPAGKYKTKAGKGMVVGKGGAIQGASKRR